MIQTNVAPRLARRAFFFAAALAALPSVHAQQSPERLDAFVTTATRTPASPQTLGSAVEVITADDLATRQVSSVSAALQSAVGVPLFASGAPGSAQSLFLRGANSNQTLFLVDGIRLNDPNADYQAFLGGAAVGAGDRIEIARGPQSTLYGAEAIGGVISLSTTPGSGTPSGSTSLEAGSFGTFFGTVASQGASGANAWSFSARAGHTDNERPNNAFDSVNVALRLDRKINDRVGMGGTVRWYRGELGSPGDRHTNDTNDVETENNVLVTTFVNLTLGSEWTARATLGGQQRRYVADTPAPNIFGLPSATTVITNRRGVFDAQTSYTGLERNRITMGGTVEATHTRNTGFGAINNNQSLWALFAQDEVTLSDSLFLTAGLRHDDFDTFGQTTTGRGTLAWLPIPKVLKLRTSYGTGFRSPSFLDLYGDDPYYVGNDELEPERQRGVDAGVDFYLPENRGTVSATWFQSDFKNLIEYDFMAFPSTVRNIGRARTQGVELTARLRLPSAVEATVSFTYLDAHSLQANGHTRLLRRPRQSVYVDAHRDFGRGLTLGAGVRFVGQRRDVDAATYMEIDGEDFTVVRAYATWQATSRLALKARVENLLDEQYEEVNGYPTRGVGGFAGVEWKW